MKMADGLLALMMILGATSQSTYAASSDVDFEGTLVAEPCMVASGEDGASVVVDFGTISQKTFYSAYGRRSWLQPFHILLTECDLSLGKEVKITFIGTEDGEQPGLLAVTSSSGVAHVAVGLQTASGIDLNINKQTDSYTLNTGNTQLNFKAYVQASDEGIKNKTVGMGRFEAVSTFELEYP